MEPAILSSSNGSLVELFGFFVFASFSVGIDNPTIEVRFEHLNVDAEAYVGNRGVPTFTNFFYNKIMVIHT